MTRLWQDVTYARWKKEHLDPTFVGTTVRINAEDFTVVGIAPEGFTGTMALVSTDLYLPSEAFVSARLDALSRHRETPGKMNGDS